MMMRKSLTWAAVLVMVLIAISCTQSCSRLQTLLENSSGQQNEPGSADDTGQSGDIILEEGQNFEAFIADVQDMRRSRIENMSSADLTVLAAPLLTLIEDTRVFGSQTLAELGRNYQ